MSPEEFVISESEAKGKEEKKDQPKEMSEEDKTLKLANIKRSQINLTFGIAAVIVVLVIFLIFNSISLVQPKTVSKYYERPQQSTTIERVPFPVTSFGFGSTVHIEIVELYETNGTRPNSANILIVKQTDFVDDTLNRFQDSVNSRLNATKSGAELVILNIDTSPPPRKLDFVSNIPPGNYYIIFYNFQNDFNTTVTFKMSQNPIGPIVPYVSVICSIFVVVAIIYFMYLRKQKLIIAPKPKKEQKEAPVPEASITIKTAPTASQPIGAGMPPTMQTQSQGAAGAMTQPMGYPPQQPYPQSQYPPRQQPPVQPRYPPQQQYPQPQYPPRQQPPVQPRYPPQQPYPQSQYPPRQQPPVQPRYTPQPYPEHRTDLSENPYEEAKAKETEEFDVLTEEPYDLLNPPEAGNEEEAAELEPAETTEDEEEEVLEPSKEEEVSPKKRVMETPSVSEKEMVSAICPTCSLELTAAIDECPKEVTCGLCGTKTVIKRR